MVSARLVWIDASAGVAGDMLLGALVDLGVPLQTLQAAVDAVLPGATRLVSSTVSRAGLRATKVDVQITQSATQITQSGTQIARSVTPEGRGVGLPTDRDTGTGTPRPWAAIRTLLAAADLPPAVRQAAVRTFTVLAEAEGRVHGVSPDEVHFHEVGAVDAVADVVGSCAGFAALDVGEVVLSPVALGAGDVRTGHGAMPVPVPAVLELARGWDVLSGTTALRGGHDAEGGPGELATPTGIALVTAHAGRSGPLPEMRVLATGVGAGTRDRPGRANVVRLVLGTTHPPRTDEVEDAVVLETNVDDLDPRVWPDVIGRLLAAGALDAWLTPIHAKKGRPAHTLHVLARPVDEVPLADLVLGHTSTLGLRITPVRRRVLDRSWHRVDVLQGQVRVKLGSRDGRLVQVMPEFDDVAEVARATGLPLAQVLVLARSAAVGAGLVPGAPCPPQTSPPRRSSGGPGPVQTPS